MPCRTWPQIDASLQYYLTLQCYVHDRHPISGSFAVNGLCYLYPEATRMLPRTWRALKSWQAFTITRQGGPEGLESDACLQHHLYSSNDAAATCAADMLATAIDGYLREQDMEQLRVSDVVFAQDDTVILLLGRSSRGDSSKAGRDQGVSLDDPFVAAVLKRRCQGKRPGDRVFPISPAAYAALCKKAAKHLGLHIGPPHSCRHTGASRDLATGYRSFAEIQRRGRWKSTDSVQRYARVHAWYEAVERQPQHIKELGASILAQRPARPHRAKHE